MEFVFPRNSCWRLAMVAHSFQIPQFVQAVRFETELGVATLEAVL